MEVKTLCDNEWLSLKEMKDPDNGVNGYVYSHETRCKGHIISILPYRQAVGGVEFLLRSEVTPCWGMEECVSSITGGLEENVEDTVLMELKEEGGYSVSKKDLINLGTCFGTKSSDTVYHLFSVDLTDREMGDASGDGSELEAKAHCFWANRDELVTRGVDPILYISLARLERALNDNLTNVWF
jgi:hypothetical protein